MLSVGQPYVRIISLTLYAIKRLYLIIIFLTFSLLSFSKEFKVYGPQGGLAMEVTLPDDFNEDTIVPMSCSENSELALVKLMELFNHSSIAITKRYLGVRQEEILETYDCLIF